MWLCVCVFVCIYACPRRLVRLLIDYWSRSVSKTYTGWHAHIHTRTHTQTCSLLKTRQLLPKCVCFLLSHFHGHIGFETSAAESWFSNSNLRNDIMHFKIHLTLTDTIPYMFYCSDIPLSSCSVLAISVPSNSPGDHNRSFFIYTEPMVIWVLVSVFVCV